MPKSDYPQNELNPRHLTNDEIENPHQVIVELFQFGHLPQLRQDLWELFKVSVTGSFKNLSHRERTNLIIFYEWIQKLVEAAHLISQKNGRSEIVG